MRQTWDWLCRGGGGWLTLDMVVASLLLLTSDSALTGCRERDLRFLGLVLQGIGFWSVSSSLRDTSVHLGSPGFLGQLRGYLAAGSFLRRRRTIYGAAASTLLLSGHAEGRVRDVPRPGASLEQRVGALGREITKHDAELAQASQGQRGMKSELYAAIEEEAAHRNRGLAELRRMITDTIAQGIALEWLGVWFFVFGMVLSSVSPELAWHRWGAPSCALPLNP